MTLFRLILQFYKLNSFIFGLTTQIFFKKPPTLRMSLLLFAYTLTLMSLFIFFYVREIFIDFTNGKIVWDNAEKLSWYTNIVAALISYFIAVVYRNAFGEIFRQAKKIEEFQIIYETDTKNYKLIFFLLLLKSLLFPLLIIATLILREYHLHGKFNLLWVLYESLPVLISNVLPNIHFGVLVSHKIIFAELNQQLTLIIKEVNNMQKEEQMLLQKSYYRMRRFCDLADQLDELAERYTLACHLTNKMLNLIALPFICALVCNLFSITAGFFMQYLAIADALIDEQDYDAFGAICNGIFLITYIFDIILQAAACNDSLVAVEESGLILQNANLKYADVRFKQSIEDFTLKTFVIDYKIKPLNLIEINVALVHDVLAAVTSFLLILIQSDLTLRFSLK